MNNSNLNNAVRLLEKARKLGLIITHLDNELTINFHKDKIIKDEFLMELRTNKEDLLDYFKKYKNNEATKSTIPVRDIDREYQNIPLSYGQERIWFIDQLEGSIQYHTPLILKIEGELSLSTLEYAFSEVVRRHEILRTVIAIGNDGPCQRIRSQEQWQLNTKHTKFIDIESEIAIAINTPFDLSNDYMLRATLLVSDNDEYILVIVLHHIASDGWSMPILIKDLTHFYKQYSEIVTQSLPDIDVQYADYAIWQHSERQKTLLNTKMDYWIKQLNNAADFDLPTDYPRPINRNYSGRIA